MDKLFIVMPAYNEAETIEDVIIQWYPIAERLNLEGNQCNIIVANDGSKDNTWDIISGLHERLHFLIPLNKENSGHGATVLYLYRYALSEGADYIFQTDSDGQTLPSEFWQMWRSRHQYDLQIGTRGTRQDGVSRIFVTRTLRIIVWIIFGVWVKDANTPFRLMNSHALSEIMTFIPDNFFLANVALSAIAVKKGQKIGWFPITFRARQGGVNSINMKRIVKIGVKSLGEFRRINSRLNGK